MELHTQCITNKHVIGWLECKYSILLIHYISEVNNLRYINDDK